jgi:hypothetical protein
MMVFSMNASGSVMGMKLMQSLQVFPLAGVFRLANGDGSWPVRSKNSLTFITQFLCLACRSSHSIMFPGRGPSSVGGGAGLGTVCVSGGT